MTPEIPEKGTENEADSRIQWRVLLDRRRQLNSFGDSLVEVRMARSWWLPLLPRWVLYPEPVDRRK